ncbi:MAG: type II secretion system protein GspM [Leptospirales bacterium]|jgi:type II secretory pathway component PulM
MLDKLEPRERVLLFAGAAVIAVVLLFVFGRTVSRMRERVSEDVAARRAAVQQMIRLRDNITGLKAPTTPPNRSQFVANVNNLLSQYGLNASAFNEKEQSAPGRTIYVISMTLRSVSLEALLKYLHAVEYGRRVPASVENIRINRAVSGKEVYDINLTLSLSVPNQK